MQLPVGFLLQLAILSHGTFGQQERSYYFTPPHSPQFQPSNFRQNGFINAQGFGKIAPGFEHLDSYLAHPDLDTSDLSPHLRRTLPQYQVGFLENPVNPLKFQVRKAAPGSDYDTSKPAPFSQQIAPSTHRPNYSHLFSKTLHNYDPQTETFLGQITIQSPAELPKTFHGRGFQPSPNFSFSGNQLTSPTRETRTKVSDAFFKFPGEVQHLDATQRPVANTSRPNAQRADYLSHRTRIVAPESGNFVRTDDYFVNSNGDVFESTKLTTTIPITTLKRKHFTFTTVTTSTTPSTTVSTTTQPARTIENTFNIDSLLEEPLSKHQPSSNDNVEVVEQVTLPPDQFYTIKPSDMPEAYEVTSDFEYEPTDTTEMLVDEVSEDTAPPANESKPALYDVLTTKPSAMVKDDQFSKFIDSGDIDKDVANKTALKPIVSVVTTKSIINNTMIASQTTPDPKVTDPMALLRSTREQMPSPVSPTDNDEISTEGWVVVASVQTSRSVSGARYLPFPVVEQHERTRLLNEPSYAAQNSSTSGTSPDNEKVNNSSTESLIDKLDRVQSDLSSDVLTDGFNNDGNNIAVITEPTMDKTDETTTNKIRVSTYPPVVIRKFSPHARPSTRRPKFGFKPKTKPPETDKPQADQPVNSTEIPPKILENLLSKIKFKDNSNFLPADYATSQQTTSTTTEKPRTPDIFAALLKKTATLDISSFLPSNYNKTVPPKDKPRAKNTKLDDVSAFLPPGYKLPSDIKKTLENPLKKVKQDDVSKFLPPDFKPESTSPSPTSKSIESLLKSQTIDISAFLPPDYKSSTPKSSIQPKGIEDLFTKTKVEDISAFLPLDYQSRFAVTKSTTTTSSTTSSTTSEASTAKSTESFKVVFPSRPGGGTLKKANRLTTPKATYEEAGAAPTQNNLQPIIYKGWPSRATTEFTGWPTPSTTPISIEKLLEVARAAATTASVTTTSTTLSTTTGTTTTTTTAKPTTPGFCSKDCDLAGTIKLTSGVVWVPELLDRNTREWQLLANEVQYQLEDVFTKSDMLSKWYKQVRIDGFSEGSVLVDYVVELNNVSQQINTRELKGLFNSALTDTYIKNSSSREAKANDLGNDSVMEGKLVLGNFVIDPMYTDFVVLPKQILPTVGYAEDNVFLPQWAIAIIVIGLASLLFVIIFGVTVLINKQKNAKKKQPSPLTEDMLNELNKSHMGGFDNYAADDLYNMDDVWNETPYDTKLPKKRSASSLQDTSMPNIYDSWKSEWNGYYYNTQYGNNHPGGSQVGYGRRRSDYDTNF